MFCHGILGSLLATTRSEPYQICPSVLASTTLVSHYGLLYPVTFVLLRISVLQTRSSNYMPSIAHSMASIALVTLILCTASLASVHASAPYGKTHWLHSLIFRNCYILRFLIKSSSLLNAAHPSCLHLMISLVLYSLLKHKQCPR